MPGCMEAMASGSQPTGKKLSKCSVAAERCSSQRREEGWLRGLQLAGRRRYNCSKTHHRHITCALSSVQIGELSLPVLLCSLSHLQWPLLLNRAAAGPEDNRIIVKGPMIVARTRSAKCCPSWCGEDADTRKPRVNDSRAGPLHENSAMQRHARRAEEVRLFIVGPRLQ